MLTLLKTEFPNLTLTYVSSLQWVGYGTANIVEPSSGYEMGFGVKWTIEDQIEGDPSINADPGLGPLRSPWIAWGPYTWADGLNPRSDGLTWECSDFRVDGYHSSESGSLKVGGMLLDFLSSEETANAGSLEMESSRQPRSRQPRRLPRQPSRLPKRPRPLGPPQLLRPPPRQSPTTTADGPPRPVEASPQWLWIVAGGAVVLLIGTWVVSRRNR